MNGSLYSLGSLYYNGSVVSIESKDDNTNRISNHLFLNTITTFACLAFIFIIKLYSPYLLCYVGIVLIYPVYQIRWAYLHLKGWHERNVHIFSCVATYYNWFKGRKLDRFVMNKDPSIFRFYHAWEASMNSYRTTYEAYREISMMDKSRRWNTPQFTLFLAFSSMTIVPWYHYFE